jgi:tetratricopeptide (TPR) repeat protein
MQSLRRIIVPVLIVLLLTAGLCYGQSAAKQRLVEGVGDAAQGNFSKATVEFENASEADLFNESAKDSLRVIQDVTDKQINSRAAIHLFKGALHAIKEREDEAIIEYSKAIEIHPGFAMAYRTRGLSYIKTRRIDLAIADLTKAIEISPGLASAYFFRGVSWEMKNDMDKAIAD